MYLDYKVSSGPFLRFSLRFEFVSEMFETRDPSLTIFNCVRCELIKLVLEVGLSTWDIGSFIQTFNTFIMFNLGRFILVLNIRCFGGNLFIFSTTSPCESV